MSASRIQLRPDGSEIALAGTVGSVFETIRVPIPGLYNAYNALAALAAARALDLGLAEAIRALATFRPAFGRLEIDRKSVV